MLTKALEDLCSPAIAAPSLAYEDGSNGRSAISLSHEASGRNALQGGYTCVAH